MRDLLKNGTRRLYPPAEDRTAWEQIPAGYREEIRKMAAEYAKTDYPPRTMSGFLAFVRNGDRQADEKPYFTRRRKLCAAVMNCCAFPDAGMDDVMDGIWLLCDDRFLISNLRRTYISLNLELTKEPVYDDLKMELTHTCDDGLACLLIRMSTECGILFSKLCE